MRHFFAVPKRASALAGVCLLALSLTAAGIMKAEAQADKENLLYIELDGGRVVIEMLPHVAPRHVQQIKALAREGFYDGIIFHRVIDGFMAQTGDPTGTGRGGSHHPNIPLEASQESFTRGAVGMARSALPDSANSQFFIMFDGAPHLDGQYTVWGRVVEGMEHVDAIARGEPPADPDKMLRVRVAADVEE